MKYSNKLLLLSILFITGCNNNTTSESSSSGIYSSSESIKDNTSVEENGYSIINTNADLNILNKNEGLTPSIGKANILVIPVHFKNVKDKIDTDYLQKAFNSKNDESLEWVSVSEFFEKSSYGKLDISFDIQNVYTTLQTTTYYGSISNYVDASNMILNEALKYYEDNNLVDFTKYDANNDGYIDGIIMVNDAPMDVNRKNDLWWAYTTYYSDKTKTYGNKKICSNVFATRDFFTFDGASCDTHTIIHEITHMFGIDDYYDYNVSAGTSIGGLGWADLMDHDTKGDHNSFTKSLLNWTTNPYLIDGSKDEVTIKLKPFESSGEYIILANDFDMSKGLYQEYFALEYYTNTGLNTKDKLFGVDGIRMLHLKADTKKDGTFKYNNSSTAYKIISQITTSNGDTYLSDSSKADDTTLFLSNEKLEKVKYYDETPLRYNFVIDSLDVKEATITIKKTY